MTTLAVLNPIDPGTGSRVTVRVCSSQDPDVTGAAGESWWPAMTVQPEISLQLFDGDFTAAVEPGSAQIAVRLDVLREARRATTLFPRVERYDWAGAECVLYRFASGLPVDLAVMRVESFAIEDDVIGLRLGVDGEWADADVLFNEYAGTGGIEGGADLKGQPKPWVFGRALNVEPVFINEIDNVFQVSGYGAVSAIPAVYERGASFGASVGNFANYAALVAASIPPGRWGTCLAQGLIRLGAPPAGVITCDVDGDSTSGFLRRTGAVIKEIGRRLGVTARLNTASLDALDAAVARNINIVIAEQTSFIELARRMVAPCNAVAGLGLDGRLIAPRVAFGSEVLTLDAQGRQMPPVLGMARQNTRPPYKRIRMGAARSWRVHSFDEIAFFAALIDRGLYVAGEVYREGNIVESADKSRWVYINPVASSGNAPPTWPATSNAFWQNSVPPLNGNLVGGIIAPANANRVPFSRYEGGRGWAVLQSSFASVSSVFSATDNALIFVAIDATSSAANQNVFLGNNPRFPVVPGERLSVSATFRISPESGPAPSLWRFDIEWFNASGSSLGTSNIAIGSGSAINLFRAAFVTAPSGSQSARLSLRAESAGSGTLTVRIASPMVASAASGQTVHPAFTPGPNGEDGATVGAPAGTNVGGVAATAIVNRTQRFDNTTGRVTDPRAYNTQAILGPRNVTNLVPSYTVGGSNVTVNLPAHTRRIAGPTGPITLSYGAVSGVVAFQSYWTAYIDDPNLTGFASPTATFTTNPDDLLFPGRYQIAAGIAPAAGGSGGAVGGGGGGGGYNPNIPPGTQIP